jgi:hypothetical protein
MVEATNKSDAAKHTIIKGIRLINPKAGQMAEAMEPEPDETYVAGDEDQTVVTVTNGERLQTVTDILTELEKNEILGEATVIDVTDMGDIVMNYGTKTTVLLGDPGRMDEKIEWLKAIISDDSIDLSGTVNLTELEESSPVTIIPD